MASFANVSFFFVRKSSFSSSARFADMNICVRKFKTRKMIQKVIDGLTNVNVVAEPGNTFLFLTNKEYFNFQRCVCKTSSKSFINDVGYQH